MSFRVSLDGGATWDDLTPFVGSVELDLPVPIPADPRESLAQVLHRYEAERWDRASVRFTLSEVTPWWHLLATLPRAMHDAARAYEERVAAELLAPVLRRIELDAAHDKAIREGWSRAMRATAFTPQAWDLAVSRALDRALSALLDDPHPYGEPARSVVHPTRAPWLETHRA